MSAYFKSIMRAVVNNLGRFIAITCIILLGIAFVSGLGTLSDKVEFSLSEHFAESEIADIIVKSKSQTGLNQEQIEKLSDTNGVLKSQTLTMLDMTLEDKNTRIYVTPLSDTKINHLTIKDGRLPNNENEIVIEQSSDFVEKRELGEKITFMGSEKTIVGIVANPLITCVAGELDQINEKELQQIIYLDSKHYASPFPLPITDMYITIDNLGNSYYSKEYEDLADSFALLLETRMADDNIVYLTLNENIGVAVVKSYAEKIDIISLIFPVFFIAVAALVVLTTMTRMIEEDRNIIGCYKTLGFGDGKVAFKYISFSLLCCIIGSSLGAWLGVTLLPLVIYPAFNVLFFMPPMVSAVNMLFGLIAAAAMFVAVLGVTIHIILKELRTNPANLLRPKAPKAGKKIFLERMTFFWKHLSFRYKSTLRNIFRYKKHLIMTIISVAGSTALVFAGFGLSDVSTRTAGNMSAMASSFSMISGVVIIFAILLCVLVIYNLTNMNIGERKREIATLKVLGYHEYEVSGYIYREILIMALFGIILGVPLGTGLLYFVLEYLDFGAIQDVQWYSYIAAAAITIAAIGIVDLLLLPKIRKIDMTTSLKTVE